MDSKQLAKLCKSLSKLCKVPIDSPGALYCQKGERHEPDDVTASKFYESVAKKLKSRLRGEGSALVEDTLVEGFDREQHYQQAALISAEFLPVFIPTIAFSETQVSTIKFPIAVKKSAGQSADGESKSESNPEKEAVLGGNEGEEDEAFSEEEGGPGRVAEEGEGSSGEEAASEDGDSGDGDSEKAGSEDEIWSEDKANAKRTGALSDSEEDVEDGVDDEENLSDEEDSLNLEDMDGEDLAGSEGPRSPLDVENWDQIEGEDGPDDDDREEEENKKNLPLSSFEKSSRRLAAEINRLEERQISEKPWQMKGDVEAAKRPVNSLLSEVLEYDMTQRPAPVVTEEVTHSLEDIILKRIRDKAYDDVERKIKPVEAPRELKKKITLDQEKSKLSLAEVYEQEYIKQKSQAKAEVSGAVAHAAVAEELTETEKMIDRRLTILFRQLDCLSNFHYTPLPRTAEVEVVSNLPAINVEEVGQEALTSANLLTADEVAGKFKRTLKGSTEKTKTDKKRERRKKKVHQAEKFKKLSLVEAAKSAPPTKGKGHIRLADPALKSSAQFFSQLETQAKKHIQGSKRPAEEQFKSDRNKAKKFKL
ncbi:u3 small nucleolar ribonucleoprotein [Nesidiocoris tenuis]|uniref:U3 small nucleolar ribonucleoprotein protein MPP10 n=1 Tax=Nesidiocoris tenuis TaxID=355587 RepID=A0ABN7B6N6_9HEMI|nr:u3 small nucleolar ribonucleoprotein [Nesidiocoris tenuis]